MLKQQLATACLSQAGTWESSQERARSKRWESRGLCRGGRVFQQGGVGAAGPCAASAVPGCDAGDVAVRGLSGSALAVQNEPLQAGHRINAVQLLTDQGKSNRRNTEKHELQN
uniref:Uncharacterized protein n=1 Tax=Meleagris gallopavo TaxID=9103 RepID=A0A803YBQ3_MELGA